MLNNIIKKYLNIFYIVGFVITLYCIILYYNYSSSITQNEITNYNRNSISNIIEISNPTFKNKGLDTNPYEISADRGVQIDQDIELYNIFAKFTDKDRELTYITADKGFYSQNIQLIELLGNILIYDDLGNQTSTQNAIIDIPNKKINLSNKVISISNTSTIRSNKSMVDDVNNTIIYKGNVKVKIKND